MKGRLLDRASLWAIGMITAFTLTLHGWSRWLVIGCWLFISFLRICEPIWISRKRRIHGQR